MFLEAVFDTSHDTDKSTDVEWHDHSTSVDFIFESKYGVVRLRKRHAYPQATAYVQGKILVIGYGNVPLAKQIARTHLHKVDEQLFLDDEFLYIEIDLEHKQVRVQRDALSTLPVFVGSQKTRVVLASRQERVVQLLNNDQLSVDHAALIRYLCGLSTTYTTLFNEIINLHDRMRFSWAEGVQKLEFAPPQAALTAITKQRSGSIRQLRQQLEGTLDKYIERYSPGGRIACEWSGGVDSTLVTSYLSDKGQAVTTATLVLPGTEGASQMAKLQEFNARFNPADNILQHLDAERYYFFHELHSSGYWRPLYFWEHTVISTPRRTYLKQFAERGFSSVFTGDGGDQLCEENPDPYPHLSSGLPTLSQLRQKGLPIWWTPAFESYLAAAAALPVKPTMTLPPLSHSAALGGACGGNDYIEQGLWLVRPLADPRLYAYYQSLPLRFRLNKNTHRMYLEARRAPYVMYGGRNEDHNEFFYYAAANAQTKAVVERLMSNSVLHNAGLIDKAFVVQTFNDLASRQFSGEHWRGLHDIMLLLLVEINLQTSGVRGL